MADFQVAIGGIPLPGRYHISLGERHPSHVGVVAADISTTDGVIEEVRIQPGYLHRAAEKLFEVRDYRSLIMLADRHDWLASFSGELVVTLAVESAMRLTPPPRATRLRTLLAEYARLHSHLSFLSYVASEELEREIWATVDELRNGLLHWSGNRVHPMLCRVGGLSADVPEGWLDSLPELIGKVSRLADELSGALENSRDRFRGLAVVDDAICHEYGLSGPVARSCGLDLDRRLTGALDYAGHFEQAPPRNAGDAHARFSVLVDELRTSSAMITRLSGDVPDGPVSTKLSRRLKVPEGEHVSEVEAPWGTAGVLLVSRGGPTPWRLALRTPTFANVAALERLLVGARKDQVADVVASMGYAIGDLDK
ncbi:NADH-quinone oxidoreductase subunit D [Tessaracoccus terricola]